jgi:hypothetical protein
VSEAGVGPAAIAALSFEDVEPAWKLIVNQRPDWVSYGPVSG